MASKREQVLTALAALVRAALPNADVERNREKGARIGAGGFVIIRDGEPGEAEVFLSPLTYTYEHAVELEMAAYESATKTREEVLDEMLQAIGAAIQADRTLGDLCEWVDAAAPAPEDIAVLGAEPARWAQLTITCVYSTTSPLA